MKGRAGVRTTVSVGVDVHFSRAYRLGSVCSGAACVVSLIVA